MIACLQVPYFAAAVERRENPALAGVPLVIGGTSHGTDEVYAVSCEAARMGVRPGMSTRQAETVCPEAQLIPAVRPRYRRALDALAVALTQFTAFVDPSNGPATADGAALYYLDLGDMPHLEAVQVAQQIGRVVREEARLGAGMGLAGGIFPAHVAAVSAVPNMALVVAPDETVAFMAPLPVTLLPLDKEMARLLDLLGIRTLGQFAALPPGAVLRQFGKEGRRLQRLAQGRDDRRVPAYVTTEELRVSHAFEDAVGDRAILDAVAGKLADDLVGRLCNTRCTARRLMLSLRLENGASYEDEHLLRDALASSAYLTATLRELLDRVKIACGVIEMEVALSDLRPVTGGQLDLFVHQGEQRRRMDRTLPDLVARYGPDTFYWIDLSNPDAHLPERRFRLRPVEAGAG